MTRLEGKLEQDYDPYFSDFCETMRVIYRSSNDAGSFIASAGHISQNEINYALDGWRTGQIKEDTFLGVLGHPYFEKEFGYYLVDYPEITSKSLSSGLHRPIRSPRGKEAIIRFENKMTAILIWSILQRIEQTSDIDDLATSLMALQLVSNNQREALAQMSLLTRRDADLYPYYNKSHLEQIIELHNLSSGYGFPYFDYIHNYYSEGRDRGETDAVLYRRLRTLYDIYWDHFDVFFLHNDKGWPVNRPLIEAFFGILSDNWSLSFGFQAKYPSDPALLDSFVRKYFDGLLALSDEVIAGRHNGITYISDHLEKVLKDAKLWPDAGEVWDEQRWREAFLSLAGNKKLFDFLSPEDQIREIIGRYDYRALIDYLRTLKGQGLSAFQILACGFGNLGAASYELSLLLNKQFPDLLLEIIPADIHPILTIEDTCRLHVREFEKTRGGIVANRKDGNLLVAKTR